MYPITCPILQLDSSASTMDNMLLFNHADDNDDDDDDDEGMMVTRMTMAPINENSLSQWLKLHVRKLF